MKGIRIYLIIFGALAVISLYFFLSRRSGTYTTSKNEFAIRDTGKDNLIFHHLPQDIRYVFMQNTSFPDKSFHLARNEEGSFEIARGLVPGSWQETAKERVNQYLGYFYDVRFESFLDPGSDTLQHSGEPEFILSLELTSREKVSIELFPVYKDFNRLYARIDPGDDWIVVKYIQIDPLLKEFEYFTGF